MDSSVTILRMELRLIRIALSRARIHGVDRCVPG